MVIFFWGWRYTINVLYRRYVAPLSYCGECSTLFSMISMEEGLEPSPCLEVGGFLSPLLNGSLNMDVCAQGVIPFDTIIELAIVCPPARASSCPFSR